MAVDTARPSVWGIQHLSTDQERVLDELLEAKTPLRANVLAQAIESSEVRAREVIRELRLKGVVICSDTHGFFLARDAKDAEKTSRHLWSRVASIAKVARGFDRARAGKFGSAFTQQEQIELVFGEAG